MSDFTVTLEQLRRAGACYRGYNKVVRMLQGREFTDEDSDRSSYIWFRHDEPILLADIANNNGLDDALWATRCLSGLDRDLRLFGVWAARQTLDVMPDAAQPALDVAERYANGEATAEELSAARSAAVAARSAAWSARSAAWSAAESAAESARSAELAQLAMFLRMCAGKAPWQVAQAAEAAA